MGVSLHPVCGSLLVYECKLVYTWCEVVFKGYAVPLLGCMYIHPYFNSVVLVYANVLLCFAYGYIVYLPQNPIYWVSMH